MVSPASEFFSAPETPCEIHLEDVKGIFDLYLDGEKVLSCGDHEKHPYVLQVQADRLSK